MDKKEQITKQQARHAKKRVLMKLEKQPGLLGVGITPTNEGYAISVHLAQPLPAGTIPQKEEDVPVQVEVVGQIRAL